MQFTSTLLVALLAVSSSPPRTTAQQVSNLRGTAHTATSLTRQLEEEALSDDWWFDDCPWLDSPMPRHDIRKPNYDEAWVKECKTHKGCVWTCPAGQILCGPNTQDGKNYYDGMYCHNGKYNE